MELDIGGDKIYPGSSVNVNWMGVWYDGTVIKIGPQNNLYKVFDPLSRQEALVEHKQLKQLDSKLTQSHEKRFAFNDGESWLEVVVIDNNAIGAAKVSWRKNIHSLETETWFEKGNIALVTRNEANKLLTESLRANKSGLLPVKGLEEHSRTVQNVVYESDGESEDSSANNYSDDITEIETEPLPHQSTPNNKNRRDSLPNNTILHTDNHFPTHSWIRPQRHMIPPPLVSRVAPIPPKNIAQSSVPCIWSYDTRLTNGIAPHYTSQFFHGFQHRRKLSGPGSHNAFLHSKFHHRKVPAIPYHSKPMFQSHSEAQTMNRSDDVAEEEMGRRHSIFDQFVLHTDPKLQGKRPPRKAFNRSEGQPPEIVSASPSTITVKEGESLLLTTTATGTQPLMYRWSKHGKDLSNSPKMKYPGPGILQLLKVTTEEEGVYTCTATNTLGSASRQFVLTVLPATKVYSEAKGFDFMQTIEQLGDGNTKNMEVQEYLDALVDEIHISDDESEHPLSESRVPEIVVAPPLDSNTQLPKMSRFSTDMEQYLFGYGEDYGQLSSANIIVEEPQSKNNLDKTEDTNSIEVLTSLGSTHSHPHDDTDDITLDVHLPTEEESVSEQVKRFQSSMEQENITNHEPKKWFNRFFKKRT